MRKHHCISLMNHLLIGLSFFSNLSWAELNEKLPIKLFPIEYYSQDINFWLDPKSPDYDQPLVNKTYQTKRTQDFFEHFLGNLSPWSEAFVNQILQQKHDVAYFESELVNQFDNAGKEESKTHYGSNFRAHHSKWIQELSNQIQISQFHDLNYKSENRGIALNNLAGRLLPTQDVGFYHYNLAGQGYPFDDLQNSAVAVGTPVYILGETKNKSWSLVLTPETIAWVPTEGIGRTNNTFIKDYRQLAEKNGLAVIIQNPLSLVDEQGNYHALAYLGTVFPIFKQNTKEFQIAIPMKNLTSTLAKVSLTLEDATPIPLPATPHQFARLIAQLQGKDYGWGGLYFFNDCSAELKNLFAAFGIWMPRQSSEQEKGGYKVDKSTSDLDERLDYLGKNSKKLMTLVYIGGHIFLYVGNYQGILMTYQNMWGLKPRLGPDYRSVIGGAVFFPLLKHYPEDPQLQSQADKKIFLVIFLDQFPSSKTKAIPRLQSLIFGQ